MSVDTNKTQIRSKAERILIIGMPFPLQPQLASIEFITFHRSLYGISPAHIRFAIDSDRFTATVTVFIHTDYRPVIHPGHRIQMNHTSVHRLILKMYKPRFTRICIDPCPLMRPVNIRLTLRHYNFRVVRAVHAARAQHQLPARSHTTRRGENIIIAVAFIELRSFYRMVHSIVSVIHKYRIADNPRAFRIHFAYHHNTVHL